MKVSALTSCLPGTLPQVIEQLANLGFDCVDVPVSATEDSVKQLIHLLQLQTGCVALECDQPATIDLASSQKMLRTKAVSCFCRAIEQVAELKAPAGYLTPPASTHDDVRQHWCDSLMELGDHAARWEVEICIEHFPGRLLPTVKSTLELLENLNHENLRLLIDVGHCLISREEPAQSVRTAGKRLGYIHFDDNNGRDDLHWGLLKGQLTDHQIAETITALKSVGYDRAVCLEFAPCPESAALLREGKALLDRHIRERIR